jgi:hypothetical protein
MQLPFRKNLLTSNRFPIFLSDSGYREKDHLFIIIVGGRHLISGHPETPQPFQRQEVTK